MTFASSRLLQTSFALFVLFVATARLEADDKKDKKTKNASGKEGEIDELPKIGETGFVWSNSRFSARRLSCQWSNPGKPMRAT